MNKILIEQVKNLYKTASIVSFKNNIGFIPIPFKTMKKKKRLDRLFIKTKSFYKKPRICIYG